MSTPLRVSDSLFDEAEAEGQLLNRSAAKQVEFWAELGKRVAHSVTPTDLLALMQGIANIRVEIPQGYPIEPMAIFDSVNEACESKYLGNKITRAQTYYEASLSKPGYLDEVQADGQRRCGRFIDGQFIPE